MSKRICKLVVQKSQVLMQLQQSFHWLLMKAMEDAKRDGYDELIGIPIATGLSSTLNGMQVAATGKKLTALKD